MSRGSSNIPPVRALVFLAALLAFSFWLSSLNVNLLPTWGATSGSATNSTTSSPSTPVNTPYVTGATNTSNAGNVGNTGNTGATGNTASNSSNSSSTGNTSTPSNTSTATASSANHTSTVIKNAEQRPGLQTMSDKVFRNAEGLYQAAMNFDAAFTLLDDDLTQDEVLEIYYLTRLQCPELMQLSDEVTFKSITKGSEKQYTAIDLEYICTKTDYENMRKTCENVVSQVISPLKGKSDAEIEKACYDYITENCTYDTDPKYAGTAYGVFKEGVAKCDGISAAMLWLMEEAGIPCMTITGESTTGGPGHAWNIIQIGGTFYDLDVTNDVDRAGKERPNMYPCYNVDNQWMRGLYNLRSYCKVVASTYGTTTMAGSYHVLDGTYIKAGSDVLGSIATMMPSVSGATLSVQFENETDVDVAIAGIRSLTNMGYSTWTKPELNTMLIQIN